MERFFSFARHLRWPVWSQVQRITGSLFLALAGLLALLVALGGAPYLHAASSAPQTADRPTTRAAITRTWGNLGLYGAVIAAIAVEPSHNAPTGTVYAGTTSGDGLYRSLDGGLTWGGVYTASVQALAIIQPGWNRLGAG